MREISVVWSFNLSRRVWVQQTARPEAAHGLLTITKKNSHISFSLHILRSSNMSTNFSDLTWNKLHATPATWTCLISFFHSSLRLFFFCAKAKKCKWKALTYISYCFAPFFFHYCGLGDCWVESSNDFSSFFLVLIIFFSLFFRHYSRRRREAKKKWKGMKVKSWVSWSLES